MVGNELLEARHRFQGCPHFALFHARELVERLVVQPRRAGAKPSRPYLLNVNVPGRPFSFICCITCNASSPIAAMS